MKKVELGFILANGLIAVLCVPLPPLEIKIFVSQRDTFWRRIDLADVILKFLWSFVMLIFVYFIFKKRQRGLLIAYIVIGICCAISFMFSFASRLRLVSSRNEQLLKKNFDQGNINNIETDLECCGVEGYIDYNRQNIPVPQSCCSSVTDYLCEEGTYENVKGCREALRMYTTLQSFMIGLFLLLCIFQVVALILGVFMLRSLQNQNTP